MARKATAKATFRETSTQISATVAVSNHFNNVIAMREIPETGFLRLRQVLDVIPLGKTCWWEGVKSGRFPKPIKLSERCTAWRAEDIRDLICNLSNQRSETKH